MPGKRKLSMTELSCCGTVGLMLCPANRVLANLSRLLRSLSYEYFPGASRWKISILKWNNLAKLAWARYTQSRVKNGGMFHQGPSRTAPGLPEVRDANGSGVKAVQTPRSGQAQPNKERWKLPPIKALATEASTSRMTSALLTSKKKQNNNN